jgi:signal transduction histidine kinase/DNA-binding response OmpR family regulator
MRTLRSGLLLLCLLLLATSPLLAQGGHAYWDANIDSLRQVLAGQRADTARLRTLEHLSDIMHDEADAQWYQNLEQTVGLAQRLHRPEWQAYRLWLSGRRLCDVNTHNVEQDRATKSRGLDSLQAAINQFDRLGRQQPGFLVHIRYVTRELQQHAAAQAYFETKLSYYHQRGATENMAACYHSLAGCYWFKGDYNHTISYYLQAAELFRNFDTFWYHNEIAVVGAVYARWGNDNKAAFYLRQALTEPTPNFRSYINYNLATIYLHRRDYVAAAQAADHALQNAKISEQAYLQEPIALALKATVLIAQHRLAAAGRLLPQAQHLGDSADVPIDNPKGYFEVDAAWAQYYAALGKNGLAETAWLTAYRKARQAHSQPLRLRYLRQLADFYEQQSKPAQAAPYSLAAARLNDSLQDIQKGFQVSYYEQQQVERRQTARIARLRRAQTQATARSARERTALGWLLGGTGLLVLVSGAQWRSHRRQQRANALLAAQKAQIEEQAARLGQLDAAKNQFFANVSHELRTPLTLVLGPLDGLLTAPAPPLPAAAHEAVALAHRSARRLLELVNRILDLTKLQAGRLELRPVPTAVAPLLRRVVTQFESLAAERRVALVAPRALPEALRLLLDGDKVEQVLTNLLINALNHTPAGGAVTVGAALPDATGHYVLTVRDTGPGIAAGEQEQVFERFYQSPQRQAQGGTGLGLALSRELATLLGGTLTLESEPGLGAAFTLRFPAEELGVEREEFSVEEAEEVDLGDEEAETGPALDDAFVFPIHHSKLIIHHSTKPRVLVVEDQADLRDYLRQLLAPAYEVLTATDGQDALDVLAREAPVDLVTTDAMMPRVSGTELLARLKADPARAGLPVLMLTARADEAHRLATLTLGVDDYLTKPFVPAELLARVATLLHRHAVRRQFVGLLPEAAPTAEPPTEPAPAETSAPTAAEPTEKADAEPGAEGIQQLARWQARAEPQLANPDFGPTELAGLLCLSERTLYRHLGELAGLTPAAWLRELRLDHARRLLEAGHFGSVAEVADAAGFINARSFAARYAERFGRRPHSYRS